MILSNIFVTRPVAFIKGGAISVPLESDWDQDTLPAAVASFPNDQSPHIHSRRIVPRQPENVPHEHSPQPGCPSPLRSPTPNGGRVGGRSLKIRKTSTISMTGSGLLSAGRNYSGSAKASYQRPVVWCLNSGWNRAPGGFWGATLAGLGIPANAATVAQKPGPCALA